MSRNQVIAVLSGLIFVCLSIQSLRAATPTTYCRFQVGDRVAYGIVEGQHVRELKGNLFGNFSKTNKMHVLKDVTLLVPSEPSHVFAMAGNYKSHLGGGTTTKKITTTTTIVNDPKTGKTTTATKTTEEVLVSGQIPPKFQIPQPFFKSPSCLVRHEGNIVIPHGAEEVHYEAEMVIVIGREAANVSQQNALDYVLGVTIGNDVSARRWQKSDVQWWRAKGADTFGPCGPFIVSGLNYDDLLLQLRLNGTTVQKERTSQLIHGVAETVASISQHITLRAGDLIFTGTSGTTDSIQPGDEIEVELEGVGVLRNRVVADQ